MNGQDQLPLAGWAIVQSHGMTLIGKRDKDVLCPVYELKPTMGMTAQGLQIAHVAVPVWLLGLRELLLPEDVVAVATESFSPRQRRDLLKAVQQADELQKQMRAQDSGLVLVPSLP